MNNFVKLTEEDVKLRFITPAIENAGWDKTQISMEKTFTDGRVIVQGNKVIRGKQKKADYLLFYQANKPLAVVEAKDNKHTLHSGLQQALEYAEILDVPFAYSSNGEGFVEHCRLTGKERELSLDEFPSPQQLWERVKQNGAINDEQEKIILSPYYYDPSKPRTPRYYQQIAIDRTIEAVAKDQKRILLVMATGTGKTYTAFQIIHRLFNTKKKKKILFLADRNALIDQTEREDFSPFKKMMTKVQGKNLDSSYCIYLALYQQLVGTDGKPDPFLEFKPEFFDLIVIDECHRGSAKEDSEWRKILDYFSSATHIGMTATPKETKEISNLSYFGEPIYTYSLKQGIEDGFLAPYKVMRVGLNTDLEGFRPNKNQVDKSGQLIEDREYNVTDYDRNLIIDERTNAVAKRITEFLKKTDRMAKTIVFCVDIDHAERMRTALVNLNSDLVQKNSRYVVKITGDEKTAKQDLEDFSSVDSAYPVIATTSKLMTTGVDCKTCKLIVLDSNINSMTEFKQIIGRGTRLRPDCGKEYFTIMDFRGVSRLFADEEFDGDPIVILDIAEGEKIKGNDDPYNPNIKLKEPETVKEPTPKYRINGKPVYVLSERVQYIGADGKLINESITDYSKRNILGQFAKLENFLTAWHSEKRKKVLIEELKEKGVLLDALRESTGKEDIDDFDLICHIAYDRPPLTKRERVNQVKKKDYFSQYGEQARAVLSALLDKYMETDIYDIESLEILRNDPFREFGDPMKITQIFGGKQQYQDAIYQLEQILYAA